MLKSNRKHSANTLDNKTHVLVHKLGPAVKVSCNNKIALKSQA